MVNYSHFSLLFSILAVTSNAMPMKEPRSKKSMRHYSNTVESTNIGPTNLDWSKLSLTSLKESDKPSSSSSSDNSGVVNSGKRLPFRITNIRTGLEEEFDAKKHYLNPYDHHPYNEASMLKKFQEESRANGMPLNAYHKKVASMKETFHGARYASKPGGSVVKGDHIYAHDSLNPELALTKLTGGFAKKLEVYDKDGNVRLLKSNWEKKYISQYPNGHSPYFKTIVSDQEKIKRAYIQRYMDNNHLATFHQALDSYNQRQQDKQDSSQSMSKH